MWRILCIIFLFPPLSALLWMVAGSRGRIMDVITSPDFFPVLGLSYLFLGGASLALCAVEYFARKWRLRFACSVLAAFMLVPSTMFLMFRSQRFEVSGFIFLGVIGAVSVIVCGLIAHLVQTRMTNKVVN